jgi:hypothetical protein
MFPIFIACLNSSKQRVCRRYTWQKSLSYAPTIHTRFVIFKGMVEQKDPDPKNPREKQPTASQEAKTREQVEKLAKGEDPTEEQSKGAVDDQAPNNCRKDEFPVVFGVKPRRFRRCPDRIDRAQVSSKIWDVIGSVAYCFDRPFHPSD